MTCIKCDFNEFCAAARDCFCDCGFYKDKLPCYIGDTVYAIDEDKEIFKWTVEQIVVDRNGAAAYSTKDLNDVCAPYAESKDFGVRVFMSEEDARKVLNGVKK